MMISLNQVQLLERKVENAVSKIVALQKQNELLQSKCKDLELKNEQLNEKVFNFEREQNTIEQGILSVLNRLDFVEDSIHTLNSETNNFVLFDFGQAKNNENDDGTLEKEFNGDLHSLDRSIKFHSQFIYLILIL